MSLVQQVYAQAAMLAGVEDAAQGKLLEMLCRSAVAGLTAGLRSGLTPDDCRADFVAAAALYALAALSECDGQPEQLQLGDLTLRRGGNAAAKCLRSQAQLILSPYMADRFSFRRA